MSMNMTDSGLVIDNPSNINSLSKGDSAAVLRDRFAAALTMAGGAYPDPSAFYRCFNSLHRLDYFDPNVSMGLHIFMTRPNLNLCGQNLIMDNSFLQASYTVEGCLTLASLCKPRLSFDTSFETITTEAVKNAEKRLTDYGFAEIRMTPFIPLVSNLSTSINGMKDVVLEKYEFDGDQAGHKTAEAMGLDESQSSGECTISFIENSHLGVSMLTYLWLLYMDNTGKGLMFPEPDTVKYLEYDYMSSIYWFVTAQDMSIVLYGKLTGVMPLNTPLTSLVPSERGSAVDPKISINFHYNHSEIMKPEILYDFNFLIDKCTDEGTGYLENDIYANNSVVQRWIDNQFKLTPKNPSSDERRNKKYERYYKMTTNPGADNSYVYNGFFVPGPQNQWSGHPYVFDGKLVYKSIWKE